MSMSRLMTPEETAQLENRLVPSEGGYALMRNGAMIGIVVRAPGGDKWRFRPLRPGVIAGVADYATLEYALEVAQRFRPDFVPRREAA